MYFASDYYEKLYEMAQGLIKKDLAYVDFQTAEQISKTRGNFQTPGIESPFRNTNPADNLKHFADMRAGKYPDGHCTLRAKIDMSHGHMCMRDPVIYCIKHTPHYRTGNTWCIYPLYDYAHPLGDAIEGISHSNCSLEFDNNRALYDWCIEHAWQDCKFAKETAKFVWANHPETASTKSKAPLTLAVPRQFEFSRLNIEQLVMSKRYLKRFVDEGTTDGWDDPRMPTISGMRRRGYPASAILDFVESAGLSRTPMTVPLSALEFYIRSHLDPIATRISVVQNPIKVLIKNYPNAKNEILHIENNPHRPEDGKHEITFGKEIYIDGDDFSVAPPPKWKRFMPGGTIRLKGAYIIKCEKVVTNADGSIAHLECVYYPNSRSGSDTSGIKPNGVINYVCDGIAIEINEYAPLLHAGLELTEENINKDSKRVFVALAEPYARIACRGEPCEPVTSSPKPLQFMRKGFYTLDTKSLDKKTNTSNTLVFIKTVGLKEGS